MRADADRYLLLRRQLSVCLTWNRGASVINSQRVAAASAGRELTSSRSSHFSGHLGHVQDQTACFRGILPSPQAV